MSRSSRYEHAQNLHHSVLRVARPGFLTAGWRTPVSQGLRLLSPVAPEGSGSAKQVRAYLHIYAGVSTYVEYEPAPLSGPAAFPAAQGLSAPQIRRILFLAFAFDQIHMMQGRAAQIASRWKSRRAGEGALHYIRRWRVAAAGAALGFPAQSPNAFLLGQRAGDREQVTGNS